MHSNSFAAHEPQLIPALKPESHGRRTQRTRSQPGRHRRWSSGRSTQQRPPPLGLTNPRQSIRGKRSIGGPCESLRFPSLTGRQDIPSSPIEPTADPQARDHRNDKFLAASRMELPYAVRQGAAEICGIECFFRTAPPSSNPMPSRTRPTLLLHSSFAK